MKSASNGTTPNAGSATGIDLSALEQLAPQLRGAARQLRQYLKLAAGTAHWGDSQQSSACDEVAGMIEQARATPQHPAKPVTSIRTLQFVSLMNAWRTADPLQGPAAYDAITAHIDALLAATPQHSVTEQASIKKFDVTDYRTPIAYANGTARAQPLASTAAQPEQARLSKGQISDICVTLAQNGFGNVKLDFAQAFTREVIAALAIPASTAADCHPSCGHVGAECDFPACKASTAASEQQAGADEVRK